MNRYVKIVAGLALLLSVFNAAAYEVTTHQMLTKFAIAKSNLNADPSLLGDLGLPALATPAYTPIEGGIQLSISDIAQDGAVLEDDQYKIRVFNHFFDPQYNNFKGRPLEFPTILNIGPDVGRMSPDWALEDHGEVTDMLWLNKPQDFSFRNAQQNFYNALTASNPADRQKNFSTMFESLGMIVHHIQDMAQPQHVRNDQHTHPIPFTNFNPQWSRYELYIEGLENYAEDEPTILDKSQASLPLILNSSQYQYPIPSFSTARQFWHTEGTTTPRFIGMAEFTAQNYTSYGTEYGAKNFDSEYVGAAPGFPLPNGTNHDGSAKTIKPENVTVTLTDGSTKSGTINFVMGKVYDENAPNFPTTSQLQHLAAASLVNTPLEKGQRTTNRYYVENSAVDNDAYKILLPRAVAFSAGLINHFFRGRLNLTQSGSGWIISNVSTQPLNGVFSIYYEDASGNRFFGATLSASIGPGQSSNLINYTPPTTATKLIAVFRGQIGAEGDATLASGFYAVAGKVISYTPPPPPPIMYCYSNGHVPMVSGVPTTNTWDEIRDLGGTPGNVVVTEATQYPVAGQIYSTGPGQQLLFSTTGSYVGPISWSFYFDPAALGSTQIRVVNTMIGEGIQGFDFGRGCVPVVPPTPPTLVSVYFYLDQVPLSVGLTCSGYMIFNVDGTNHSYNATIGLSAGAHKFGATFINTELGTPGFCYTPYAKYIDGAGSHVISQGPVQSYQVK